MDNNNSRRAFVVVDNLVEREHYQIALKRDGFVVEAFKDEDSAIAALKQSSPHIAIVHFTENMTRTVAFIERLHSSDHTVCILYPTFYQGEELHAKAVAAGAYAVLSKPLPLFDEKFSVLLKSVFEESRSRKWAASGKGQALVLMPFARSFDELYRVAIKEPVEALGFRCERIDELFFIGDILQKLYDKIEQSQLIIADLSTLNANVFYETGFADALKKTVILLVNSTTKIPFDMQPKRLIIYDDIPMLKTSLEAMIKFVMQPQATHDSP
jgi:ActR/RegA family two-component response regulator